MEILGRSESLKQHECFQGNHKAWFIRQIPFFECPDPLVESLYYYRWDIVRRHLRFISPQVGHIITEFDSDEPLYWAGAYNSIVAAIDHHVREARWLHNRQPVSDYCRFWLTDPGAQPQNYSSALANAFRLVYHVTGDPTEAITLLDHLVSNHQRWIKGWIEYPHDNGFDSQRKLFWNTGRDSTGEYNLASAQLNEPLRGLQGYKIRGGAGYRPDHNAEMYADMMAIADIARLAERPQLAEEFETKAQNLKCQIMSRLWDPKRLFFMHRWLRDEYSEADYHGLPSIRAGSLMWETNVDRFGGIGHQPHEEGIGRGRELIGYLPWQYNIPDDTPEYAAAWKFLMDEHYFWAPYGPTTAERHDPWFSIQYDCRCNGNSFPLNTSRVLTASTQLLNNYNHTGVFDRNAWWMLFRTYAQTQTKDGCPYLAEFHHPDKDRWVVDRPSGRHYFHSSFIDQVITGLVGIRPQGDRELKINPLAPQSWPYFALDNIVYHGHQISIIWDRDGRRYERGHGLSLYIDGTLGVRSDVLGSLRVLLNPVDANS